MFKLVKFALVVGALAAVWMLVPVGGRTLQARWNAAAGPAAFARQAWAELDRAFSGPEKSNGKAKAGEPARERSPERSARPTEAHSDRDRRAVDQIVAEHLRH